MRFILLNRKTISAFSLWLFCVFLHKHLASLIYQYGTKNNLHTEKPLLDVFHLMTPNLQDFRMIPEILHLIPILYLFKLIFTNLNSNGLNALNKLLKNHGMLLVLRAICFSSTLLPDASQQCVQSGYIGSCFDLIFSGHCMAIYLATLVIEEYFNISRRNYIILSIINVITVLLIILCRNHYTIDIVVALLATDYVFHITDF